MDPLRLIHLEQEDLLTLAGERGISDDHLLQR
jgi:hypothetical protein